MTDDEDLSLPLIDKILAGIAVEENSRKLYELHRRKVLNFFRNKHFSPTDCEDLTQDVFFRVFKSIDTFRRESRFERWLFEIAINIFRNKIREKKAEKRDAREVSIDGPSDDDAARIDLPSEEESVLLAMIEGERRVHVMAELKKLPLQMRRCCELRYIRGLKYHEIAEEMNISIETVKAHLHQARKRLMEKLGGK